MSIGDITTGESGIAETDWTLGPHPGAQRVVAMLPGFPPRLVSFTATAAVGPAATVSTLPQTLAIDVGEHTGLDVVARDAFDNPVDEPPTFQSNDPAVAAIDESGIVAGVGAGVSGITVKVGNASVVVPVTVRLAPVDSVHVGTERDALDGTAVDVGSRREVYAVPFDRFGNALADRAVTWSSADEAIATVRGSDTAYVRGVSKGVVQVTATSEGRSASINVHVIRLVLVPRPIALAVGDSVSVSIREAPEIRQICRAVSYSVTWSSSDSSRVTVTPSAVTYDAAHIKAVAPGAATVSGTCNLGSSGLFGTGKVRVTVP